MSDQKVIFSGCGHELERVIADMSCPVCARKKIERLQAECEKYVTDNIVLAEKNERLREALNQIMSLPPGSIADDGSDMSAVIAEEALKQ